MQLRNQKGFTLIEIAIVLTIVGLVIGGIWLAASTVTNNNNKTKLTSQVIQTVQNVKNIFSNQTGANPVNGFDTNAGIAAGVFPAGMVQNGLVRHPYATTQVNSVTVAGAATGNNITLTVGATDPLPRDACIDLVSAIATQENFARYGIVSINGLTTAGATPSTYAQFVATCAAGGAAANTDVVVIFTVP